MAMKLSRDQKYFSLLKAYEKAKAKLLAPFKGTNAKPAMAFIEDAALKAIPGRDREFFVKEREERKGRYPTFR